VLSVLLRFTDFDYPFVSSNSSYVDQETEIKKIKLHHISTDTATQDSDLSLYIEIDSEDQFRTRSYYKRNDINFPILNIPFICSNIQTAPEYGVYISQYSRVCGSYQNFLDRGLLSTRKLMNHRFLVIHYERRPVGIET